MMYAPALTPHMKITTSSRLSMGHGNLCARGCKSRWGQLNEVTSLLPPLLTRLTLIQVLKHLPLLRILTQRFIIGMT